MVTPDPNSVIPLWGAGVKRNLWGFLLNPIIKYKVYKKKSSIVFFSHSGVTIVRG